MKIKKIFNALFEKKESPKQHTLNGAAPVQKDVITEEPDKKAIYNDVDFHENYKCYEEWLCPYCHHQFEKQITRKRKCPKCNNIFIVRTHFYTKRKMILKEEQLLIYEKIASVYWEEKWIEDFFKHYDTTLEDERKNGASGSSNPFDIAWGMLNRIAGEKAEKMQWGLYRNARMGMGDLLRKEGKLDSSLLFYLEVCFLDINGPINNLSPEFLKKFPPYQPKESFLAPGIVNNIESLKLELNLCLDDIQKRFVKHNTRAYKDNVLIPLSAEKAWKSLEKELLERCET